MDNTTFKPYTYDPQFFIDKQAATADLLSGYGVDNVSELPLSSFYNYTAAEQNLNQIVQQTGVNNFIGNQLAYISAGETTGSYTTGVLTTPTDPQRNLLNRYHPTVNFKSNSIRHTREQIGGHWLPHRVAVLNYISVRPQFRVLTDRLQPGETYVVADPTIYGSGQGNNNLLTRSLPVDHDENVTWIKSDPVYAGQAGRIINTEKQPNFYNYTSTEQTLGAPKHGVCKFTDNFDFFAGSVSGDVWANEDIYKLTEANKFDMVNRQRDLLTDICDSPYRWRTDIYGNEYMFYKLGTQHPKRTAGGSDTDDDGRDDELNPGQGLSDYYQQEIDQEGVFISSNTSVTFGGGADQDGGGFAPTNPGDITPVVQAPNQVFVDPLESQLPLAECDFFLFGGDSLSPNNSATNLDMTYRFQTSTYTAPAEYTVAGAISAIIDGGWRSQQDQQSGPGDQYTNQFEQTSATPVASVVTGFFDLTEYQTSSAGFIAATDEVSWFPDWTRNSNDTRSFPSLTAGDTSDVSYTFSYATSISDPKLHDRAYVFTPPESERRTESNDNFPYVLADGGWYNYGRSATTGNTFFRTQCDRASYILARYGNTGAPEFGNHIFACKIFEITGKPEKYMPLAKEVYGDDIKRYDSDLRYAKQRGALNATSFRNPIEWSAGVDGQFGRNIQFFGTLERLQEWKNAIGISGTKRAGLARLPDEAFDYLTLGEYYHMRISSIEGSGTRINNITTFFDADVSKSGSQDDNRPRYLGTPDIFYYLSGGSIDYVDVTSDGVETPGTAEYSAVSGEVSYIHSSVNTIQLYDVGSIPATQFPQIRHDTEFQQEYNISVESYNSSTCENVSEYRIYTGGDNPSVTIDRTVNTFHPVSAYHNQTFKSKRGYFPPPVGHLRRTQTFPAPGTPSSLSGSDEPIPHNLLPDTTTPGPSGFYVHDVWDGSGFLFQAGADQTSVTQEPITNETEREAQIGEDNISPIGYVPQTDTVVTLDGNLVANLGCGGYTGYFNVTSVAPSPYLTDVDGSVSVPLGSVAQMVKRSSDTKEDMCYIEPDIGLPTLWEQKNLSESPYTQLAPAGVANIVIRNLYSDSIVVLSEIVAPFAQQFDEGILSGEREFIDMDVINDTLVLRQNDSTGNRQTYVFDQVKFDYDTGSIQLGQRATYSVTTQSDPRSSLLSHYYNEDDNCLIVGYTHVESSTHVYPVLYKLDLRDHSWSEIYPKSSDTQQFQITQSDFDSSVGVNYELISIDPGEISFNPVTNNYCVTYFGDVVLSGQTTNSSPAIFNHVFENRHDHIQLASANMYHSQNKGTTPVEARAADTVYMKLTESGNRGASEQSQQPITQTTSSATYDLKLNLTNLDGTIESSSNFVHPVQLHVDWGDGETSTIYSDYVADESTQASFRRYGKANNRVKVSENTVLQTPPSYNSNTSLTHHKLIHTYKFETHGTTTATVSCYMNDSTTTYNNQINIDYSASDINTTLGGVKLLNTKLYSSTSSDKQHLLMTLETQSPRQVAHNIIDINT